MSFILDILITVRDHAEIIFYITFTLMVLAGGYLIIKEDIDKTGILYNRTNQSIDKKTAAKSFIRDRFTSAEVDEKFKSAGINLTAWQYNAVRMAVCSLIAVYFGINMNIIGIFGAALLVVLTEPAKILGITTPALSVIHIFDVKNEQKINDEVFRSCLHLKNMILARTDRPANLEYYMQMLINNTSGTFKKHIMTALSVYRRSGAGDEAFEQLKVALKTKEARSLVSILAKFDFMPPSELVEQLEILVEAIQEERQTKSLKAAEMRGAAILGLTTISMLAAIMNFCMVVVFLKTIADMSSISFG